MGEALSIQAVSATFLCVVAVCWSGSGAPEVFNVVIEIAKGSKVKYELDKDSGMLMVRACVENRLRQLCEGVSGRQWQVRVDG